MLRLCAPSPRTLEESLLTTLADTLDPDREGKAYLSRLVEQAETIRQRPEEERSEKEKEILDNADRFLQLVARVRGHREETPAEEWE